jgi:hypothetical protein
MDKQDEKHSRELWSRFLTGDDEAFGLLYTAHVNRLYGYGLHYTSGSEPVKDCVRDLSVKPYANRKCLHAVENVRVYRYHCYGISGACPEAAGACPEDTGACPGDAGACPEDAGVPGLRIHRACNAQNRAVHSLT